MNNKKFKKINNYLLIILAIWSSTTCFLTFQILNNPGIILDSRMKEIIPEDKMFTVPSEIIGYNYGNFNYKIRNFKGDWERYRINEINFNIYEIEYGNYLEDSYPEYQFHIYLKKINGEYKSFIYVYKKWYDNIPKQVFFLTNSDSTAFYSFIKSYYNIRDLRKYHPWFIYKPLKVKRIIVDFKKSRRNLDFFNNIKVELSK